MVRVPQAMSTIWQRSQMPPISQPRDLDRKPRSEPRRFLLLFDAIESPRPNIARAICLEFNQVTSPSYPVNATTWPRTPRRKTRKYRPVMVLTVRHLMTLSIAKGKHPLVALVGLIVASLAILPLLPPVPQDPSYHQFADQRTLLGIPNFWNVISNLSLYWSEPWGCGNSVATEQVSFFSWVFF
jgi:hypothetical protein